MTTQIRGGREAYRERRDLLNPQIAELQRESSRLSLARLVSFLAAVGCFFTNAWIESFQGPLVKGVGLAATILFVGLVLRHRSVAARLEQKTVRRDLCDEGLHRIERSWTSLREMADPEFEDSLGIAKDLDLTGTASLYRLTGGASTEMGRRTLLGWLLGQAAPDSILSRQAMVRELAIQTDVQLDVAVIGISSKNTTSRTEPFLSWAEDSPFLHSHPAILWVARLLAPLPIALFLLHSFGVISRPFWLIALLVNFAFSGIFAVRMNQIFSRVSSTKQGLDRYFGLLKLFSSLPLKSALGVELLSRLTVDGRNAAKQMQRLEKIINYVDLRFSPMLHFPIQLATLWDFFWLHRLEKWQVSVGRYCRSWLDTLGELEAICSLSVLAHDNPSWCFPKVSDPTVSRNEGIAFHASGLGHPLLPPKRMVTNDVHIGPKGRFLLVTGSNMSGKSTLLRAVGINAALVNAGGPVCASSLSTPPIVLGTSFRITDSVEKGISFYMAELMRIKAVVDLASRVHHDPSHLPLFLFDEILQGTNIKDRQTAVRAIILHLMGLGAIGAISSHDLTLAEAPGISERADLVYFTEKYIDGDEGPKISFDYLLRQGIAPTTNALALVRLVGLDLEALK